MDSSPIESTIALPELLPKINPLKIIGAQVFKIQNAYFQNEEQLSMLFITIIPARTTN